MNKQQMSAYKRAFEASKTCDHPIEQRHQIGFGIFCGKCKIRLSLVQMSTEQFTQSILDDLKKSGAK